MLEIKYLTSLNRKQRKSIDKVIEEFEKCFKMTQDENSLNVYLDAYKNAFDDMEPNYAEKRAKVAIDWVECSLFAYAYASEDAYLNSFLVLLYFRLAYDIKNQTELRPDFLTKKIEDMANFFNSLGTEEKFGLALVIDILIAGGVITVFISTILWLAGVMNPLTMPILLLPIILGIVAFIFDKTISYIRKNLDIEKQFINITPDEGIHAIHTQRFSHSRSQWAMNDRNLRPFDKLSLFAIRDDVSDLVIEIKTIITNPWLVNS